MAPSWATCSGFGVTRVSHYIRRKVASNVHHAIRIAEALGKPLNLFVTINFAMTGCRPDEASATFRKMLSTRFGHWSRRPGRGSRQGGCPPTFVWVMEAGGGVQCAHWLVHVPTSRSADFRARVVRWAEALAGPIHAGGAIDIRPARTPKGAGRYMLKGTDPAYAAFYGVDFKDQGLVHGKRAGTSQNLGPAAKKRLRDSGQYAQARKFKPFPAKGLSAASMQTAAKP
jgi:hypothetical protein